MKFDWRNFESSQNAFKELKSRRINFSEFIDAVKNSKTLWLCLKDVEFFRKLHSLYIITQKDFLTLLKSLESEDELRSFAKLSADLNFCDERCRDNTYELLKFHVDKELLTEREFIDIALNTQHLQYFLNSTTSFNTETFNIENKKLEEPLYLSLNKKDVERFFDSCLKLDDTSFVSALSKNGYASSLHFLENDFIDYKRFFNILDQFNRSADLILTDNFVEWAFKQKNCTEIFNDLFDRMKDAHVLRSLTHQGLFNLEKIINNNGVLFKKVVDQFTNTSEERDLSCCVTPCNLKYDRCNVSCLNILTQDLDRISIRRMGLSLDDLQYMLNKIHLDGQNMYLSLYNLCKNTDLLKYCIEENVFTKEMIVNFERVLLGFTTSVTFLDFIKNENKLITSGWLDQLEAHINAKTKSSKKLR